MVIIMKCEIKYIESKLKEEYKSLTIKGILLVIIISSVAGFAASFFLEESTIYIILALFLMILVYVTWEDAVLYCRNRKITNEKEIESL